MYPVFDYIKASKFFPVYAPKVTNWKHKLRGKDGNGNPIEFSEIEIQQIKDGLQKMTNDLMLGKKRGQKTKNNRSAAK